MNPNRLLLVLAGVSFASPVGHGDVGAPLHFVAPTLPLAGHVTFEGGTFVFPIHLEGLGSGTVTTTFPAGEQWTSSNGTTIETSLTFEPIGGIEFAHGWSPEIHQVRLRRPDP